MVVSMIIPIFQMKKLKIRKWKSHAHHHRVSGRAGRWTEASCLQKSILVNTLLPCCSQQRYEPSLESAFLDNYRHHKSTSYSFLICLAKIFGWKRNVVGKHRQEAANLYLKPSVWQQKNAAVNFKRKKSKAPQTPSASRHYSNKA